MIKDWTEWISKILRLYEKPVKVWGSTVGIPSEGHFIVGFDAVGDMRFSHDFTVACQLTFC